jgi:hypothetical protein
MEKIYGYKEKDIIGLANFIRERKNQSLSNLFESYSIKSGKAKGTIRNLYYELAKKSALDKNFCDKYFDGLPLKVSIIKEFNSEEERRLIKEVLIGKTKGKSVRSIIMGLSNGDGKKALRLQNKYRNAIKNNKELVSEITLELKNQGYEVEQLTKKKNNYITEENFEKLKNEINNLFSRISQKERKENEFLKEKILILEKENLRLYNLLYSKKEPNGAKEFFNRGGEINNLLN